MIAAAGITRGMVFRAAATAALLGILWSFTLQAESRIQLCGFRWLTGRLCPLCGMTHALFALAKGHWSEALHANALSPLAAAIVLGVLWVRPMPARLWNACLAVFGVYGAWRVFLAVLLVVACSAPAYASDVLTQHNNPARTGAVLDEKILSPSTLRNQGFGKLFAFEVDGQIYAQPLVVTGLEVPGRGARNVVYVATMRNMVYAFDADGPDVAPLWKTYLGAPMAYDRIPKDAGAQLGQYNIRPFIGITSTPAIDREKGLIYVAAKIAEPECPTVQNATAACR